MKTILYIEDDCDDREIFAEIVQSTGVNVRLEFAKNGFEAKEKLDSYVNDPSALPHTIITDLHMPGITGVDIVDAIKNEKSLKHIPLYVFTTGADETYRSLFKNYGVELLEKPRDFKEIIE